MKNKIQIGIVVLVLLILFVGVDIHIKSINIANNEIKLLQEDIENKDTMIYFLEEIEKQKDQKIMALEHSLTEQIKLKEFYIAESIYYQAQQKNTLLINPKYKDVMSFIKKDRTDKNKWTKDYDCTSFSNDVIRNALNENMFMCTLEANFEDIGHLMIAINTSDKGVIFIEPQTDDIISIELGYGGLEFFPKETVINWDSCWGGSI